MNVRRLVVSATFDCGALEEPLAFWLARLGLTPSVRLFGPVRVADMTTLVAPAAGDMHVHLLRAADVPATEESAARDLARESRSSGGPHLFFVVPSSAASDERLRAALAAEAPASSIPGAPPPLVSKGDGASDAYFGALATWIARELHASSEPSRSWADVAGDLADGARVVDAMQARGRKQRDRHLFDVEFVAPRTPAEERIAEIWTELLAVDRVGIQDDFVDLGGDSLLATRAVARMRDTLHVSVDVAAFFTLRTIERIVAAHVAGSYEEGEL